MFVSLHTALLTNNRLGWKGLPGTNTLYKEHLQIADVKMYFTLSPLPIL
jgi:hypothetical protein